MKKLLPLCLAATLLALAGCDEKGCIMPALEKQQIKQQKVIDAGIKLEQLQTSANLKTDFSKQLDQEFGTLSTPNTELYLFLTAIECYLKSGKVGQEIAKELATGVRMKYLRALPEGEKPAGTSDDIGPVEQAIIRGKEHGEAVLERYRELGFKVD